MWNNQTVLPEFNDDPRKQDFGIEWKQWMNPLILYDMDSHPTEVKLIPSGKIPEIFNGLSRSSKNSRTLLDGVTELSSNPTAWYYSIGYTTKYGHGNPGYTSVDDNGKRHTLTAFRTQLFVKLPSTTTSTTKTTISTSTEVDTISLYTGSSWSPYKCGDCGCCCRPEHAPYCPFDISNRIQLTTESTWNTDQ